jgi:hypothetical protein
VVPLNVGCGTPWISQSAAVSSTHAPPPRRRTRSLRVIPASTVSCRIVRHRSCRNWPATTSPSRTADDPRRALLTSDQGTDIVLVDQTGVRETVTPPDRLVETGHSSPCRTRPQLLHRLFLDRSHFCVGRNDRVRGDRRPWTVRSFAPRYDRRCRGYVARWGRDWGRWIVSMRGRRGRDTRTGRGDSSRRLRPDQVRQLAARSRPVGRPKPAGRGARHLALSRSPTLCQLNRSIDRLQEPKDAGDAGRESALTTTCL